MCLGYLLPYLFLLLLRLIQFLKSPVDMLGQSLLLLLPLEKRLELILLSLDLELALRFDELQLVVL